MADPVHPWNQWIKATSGWQGLERQISYICTLQKMSINKDPHQRQRSFGGSCILSACLLITQRPTTTSHNIAINTEQLAGAPSTHRGQVILAVEQNSIRIGSTINYLTIRVRVQ